jgi:hypothetical protein
MDCPQPTVIPPVVDATRNAFGAFAGGITTLTAVFTFGAFVIRRSRHGLEEWAVSGLLIGFIPIAAFAVYVFKLYLS